MVRVNIIVLTALSLLMTSCLTSSKKPVTQVKEGPFDSEVSDTINRASKRLPALADKRSRNAFLGKEKAVHVRRNFQNYSSRRIEKRDIEAEKPEILNACCSNKKLRGYIDSGIAFHFDYYGKNGLHVDSTVVDQNACIEHQFSDAYGEVEKRDGVFLAYSSGIVKDTRNNLEWFTGPDRNVTWHEADRWVKGLSVAGGGWRMPTLKELESLYQKGAGSRNMTPLLKTSGWWVWSGETVGTKEARSFSFGHAFKGWIFKGNSSNERVFAVRSRTK